MTNPLEQIIKSIQSQVETFKQPAIEVLALVDDAYPPTIATEGSAGFDMYATETVTIEPGNSAIVGTGIGIAIPPSLVMLLFSRSGIGFKHGIRLANAVGVIDSDYRGEIKAKIHNDGTESYTICKNDRFVQGVLVPFLRPTFVLVDKLSETERGTGGMGHTGL